ncbi:MAG TPA: hypothetical protein PLO62_06995 [Candidatus Hydrogenedentes bacterium]|nr:hypothetical protein [Candidatus Hydrogenedentota bacterium]HOS02412.1 hypothetical protein [Candidatus Hydrogenedentota bacterium]
MMSDATPYGNSDSNYGPQKRREEQPAKPSLAAKPLSSFDFHSLQQAHETIRAIVRTCNRYDEHGR